MKPTKRPLSRRNFLASLGALGAAVHLGPGGALAAPRPVLTGAIPSTGERLPVIGMGSWLTFDVHGDRALRDQRLQVLQAFFDGGGAVVDSSPMYGSSEEVIGYCLSRMANKPALFSATKVWTLFQSRGIRQMEASQRLWGADRFDLMQIHNMLDWEAHLETLVDWKAQGRLRYIGVTTSHGRRHDAMEKVMARQPIDFVQFTYNILDREAERRLLPLAAERGLAVIVNRPFRHGALFGYFDRRPLPEWAGEFDCTNWAQFFLKFIVSLAITLAVQDSAEDARRKIVAQKITVHFEGTSLGDAIAFMRDATGLNFHLSATVAEHAPDATVRLKLREVSVKTCLTLMLQPHDLSAIWREGAIVIKPRGEVLGTTSTQIYDVRSLLLKIQDFPGPKVELVDTSDVGEPLPAAYFISEEPSNTIHVDLVTDLIMSNTGGTSWDENPDVSLELVNGLMIVTHSPKVHREIATLLRRLEQYK